MSDIIKVGIAGLGRSGWNMHAQALSNLAEQYNVSSVMDLSPERRNEAEETFNCESYSSFEDLAKSDVELVVVATPSQFHTEHAVTALQAGKHVIVEKPLAFNVSEVEQMISAAKAADKLLTVNQNYRYHQDFRTMTEVMASGKLGDIVQISISIHQFTRRWDWQTLRENNGGILTNHGSHYLDWLLLNFEDDDPEVFCHMVNTPLYAGDADSHTKVIIRPSDGPLIDLELSHSTAYPQDKYVIMGTQGSLRGSQSEIQWKYFLPEKETKLELDHNPTQDRSYNSESLSFIEESIKIKDVFNEDLALLYGDLFETIRDDMALQITPESVRRQIHLLDKCRKSAAWV